MKDTEPAFLKLYREVYRKGDILRNEQLSFVRILPSERTFLVDILLDKLVLDTIDPQVIAL